MQHLGLLWLVRSFFSQSAQAQSADYSDEEKLRIRKHLRDENKRAMDARSRFSTGLHPKVLEIRNKRASRSEC